MLSNRCVKFSLLMLWSVTCSAAVAAESRSLVDPAVADLGVKFAGSSGGQAAVVDHEGAKVIAVTIESGNYPGAEIAPKQGTWDLSDYNAVRFSITNTGQARTRVHGRVDNPGDWRQSPWSINAVTLNPGQSATLTVPFGRSYGNPGYELDPSKIVRLVVFGERPRQAITLHVTSVEAVKIAAGGTGQRPAAQADQPAVVPASHTLYNFVDDFDARLLVDNNTTHQVIDHDGGKALQVTFPQRGGYPGVQLNAPAGGWDLRNRAGVEVDVTNPGQRPVTVALRIDNPGDWRQNPWNAEKTNLRPGETKTIRVRFGQSWGSPGFSLNPARVIRALVYAERPPEGAVVLVQEVRSWGHASPREVDTVDLEGVLFDFGPQFVVEGRVDGQGASARVENGRLVVNFTTNERWPAVVLRPVARRWDLSNFESIQTDLTNQGDAPVRVGMRVDNPGGPDHSNTHIITVPPGQTRTLKVTFGMSWGNQGYDLDPSAITSLLLFADNLKAAATIAVGPVKANRKRHAQVPDWVGTRPPVEGDWVQTLDENFDGPSLDKAIWTPRLVWDGPAGAETQRYIEENVYVEDGNLVIKCEINPGHQYNDSNLPTREYATGAVTSLAKWTQRYGYMEARIKRPRARGLWPAFWLMPDRGEGHGNIWERRTTNNGGMEIDIWEHLTEWGPHRYNIAAHWDGYGPNHKSWGNSHIYHLPTEDGWHHFGLLWEPGKLTWFCDGRKVGEWEDERVTQVPLYIKFTVQMGNWATKDVDRDALPDYFRIDYVRAWQLRERLDQ